MFDDIEVPGLVFSSLLALCVSPQLEDIGSITLQLLVRNADGTLRSQGTGEYISCKSILFILCVHN